MSWRIKWSKHAKSRLLNIPRSDAEQVAEAIERYARTGAGEARRVETAEGVANTFRVGEYFLILAADPKGEGREDEDEEDDGIGTPTLWVMQLRRRTKQNP
jgi:hypothetical protein